MNINEDFLCFIWENVIPELKGLTTTDGKSLRVIQPGIRNKNTGPDYFNALIQLDDLQWAGNVEIHVKTSDWLLHHHQHDHSYQNVILHVVWKSDSSELEFKFNTLEVSRFIKQDFILRYEKFVSPSGTELPCADKHHHLDGAKAYSTFKRYAEERVKERTEAIEKKFIYFRYNWHQLFYSIILESFGFHVNSLAMFQLSEKVNFNILIKESNSLLKIYALLVGASSLLYEMQASDEKNKLIQEFEYLKNKYRIDPLPEGTFKLYGIRPYNHPLVRLAQFSCLFFMLHEYFQTLNFPLEKKEFISLLERSVNTCANPLPSLKYFKPMGKNSLHLILINAWSLFLYYRGIKTGQDKLRNFALDMIEFMPGENNYKTRLFKKLPLNKTNALITQGMIHLYNEYCRKKRCYDCNFGKEIMKMEFF